jgi:hypothetical protein
MRITKNQLRRIIKEAIDPREMEEPLGGWAGNALTNDPDYAHPRGDLGKNIADVDFPIVIGYNLNGRDQSEIAYNQDELDDILDDITPGPASKADLPYSLDSLKDLEPQDIPAGLEIENFREGSVLSEAGDPIADEMLGDFLMNMAQELTDMYDPQDAHRLGSDDEFQEQIGMITTEVEDFLRKRLGDLWSGDLRLELMG